MQGMNPEDVMQLVASNFGKLFPVPGHATVLCLGENMDLHPNGIPFFPVKVTQITSTGWTFSTRVGHVDYPGFISFRFYVDYQHHDMPHLMLKIHANINGIGWIAEKYVSPLLNAIYNNQADHLWGKFAQNIADALPLPPNIA